MPPMRVTRSDARDGDPPGPRAEPHAADEREDAQLTAGRLGRRIREIRKSMNMTARALAQACEITPGFVSQMENGTVLPSIPTLLRLAAELRVRPSELLQPDAPSTQLVRVPDRRVYEYPDRGFREAIISSDEANLFEVAWAVIEPGGGTGPELFTHGSTSECVVAVRGQIDIHVGDDTFVLKPGDCVTFSGASVHGCVNRGDEPAELYWVTAPAVY
jgi:transcriptional regulator with XRE-family HTH domain